MTSHPRGSTGHADGPAAQTIGPYRLIEVLGEGGMGTVWLAEQLEPVRRQVALKVVRAELDSDEVLARFDAERQVLALMNHPNIAQVFDAGRTADGVPYFVMEHVPGIPLTEFCDRRELDLRARLTLFIDVCRGVQHAHQKGIVHRDLKPSNVLVMLVDDRPVPKIIDFGVAKATQPLTGAPTIGERGRFVGTPAYMSPEQADPSPLGVDSRTDVYSLGVLLYELLVGVTPFDPRKLSGPELARLPQLIREQTPTRPSTKVAADEASSVSRAAARRSRPRELARRLRGDLDAVTLKALQKDPERRYPSASELALDVQRYLDGLPVGAGPHNPGYRLVKFLQRNRLPALAGAAAVLGLVMGLTIVIGLYREAKESGELAKKNLETAQSNEREAKALLARAVAAEAAAKNALDGERAALNEAVGQRLGAQALNVLDSSPTLALLLAIEGIERAPGGPTTIALYNVLERHNEVAMWGGHDGPVRVLDLDPNGDELVSGDDTGFVLVRDARTGEIRQRLDEHAGGVRSCGFLPDVKRVWSAGEDGQVLVWDRVKGTVRLRIPCQGEINRAVLAAEGTRVVAARMDGTVLLCDVVNGGEARVLYAHPGGVTALAASRDGRRVATVGRDLALTIVDLSASSPGAPRRIELTKGEPVPHYNVDNLFPPTVVLSADGSRALARSRDGQVALFDAATGAELHRFVPSGEFVKSAALSPDGKLVYLHFDAGRGSIRGEVFDDAGRRLNALRGAPMPERAEGVFSPDGSILVSHRSEKLDVWDVVTGRLRSQAHGAVHGNYSVTFLADGSRFAAGGQDGFIHVFDPSLVREEWRLAGMRVRGEVAGFDVNPDGESGLAIRNENGKLSLDAVDLRTGRRLLELLPPGSDRIGTTFSRGGTHFAVAVAGGAAVGLRVWDLTTRRILFEREGSYGGPRFSANSQWLCVMGPKGIEVYETRTGRPAGVIAEPGNAVFSCEVSSDGARVAAAEGGKNTTTIWDVKSGKPVHRIAHKAFAFDATFDNTGKRLLTFANETVVEVTDTTTWRTLVRVPRIAPSSYGHAAWSPDGTRFAVDSGFEAVLCDAWGGTVLARWNAESDPSNTTQMTFAADGRTLISPRASGRIRFLPLDPLAVARASVPRVLTASEMETFGIGTAADRAARAGASASSTGSVSGLTRHAQAALMRGDADEALSILARAPGLRPNLPAIYHIVKARALALRQGSEDLTLAMTELESARAKKGLDKDDLTLTSEFAPLRARPEFDALLKSLDR